VAGFVDADKGEFRGLLDLPVCDTVGGEEINEAWFGGKVVVVYFFGDCLPAEPVAVVVGLEGMLNCKPAF
jgi:hypothetical protein